MTPSRHLRLLRGDDGASLLELLAGVALMAVFGALFSGAVFMMTSSTKAAQTVVDSSTQLGTAFNRLDETLRYAAAINTPGRSSGTSGAPVSWYVEYRTTNTGAEVCTQLRVDQATAQLQQRTWTVVSGAATGASGWTPLASGITNGDVVTPTADRPVPFALVPTTGSVRYPSVTVALVAGGADPATSSMSVATYPASNATATTATTGVCQELGRP